MTSPTPYEYRGEAALPGTFHPVWAGRVRSTIVSVAVPAANFEESRSGFRDDDVAVRRPPDLPAVTGVAARELLRLLLNLRARTAHAGTERGASWTVGTTPPQPGGE